MYYKQFLHPDEDPFFAPHASQPVFYIGETNVAFAICYEISVDQHAAAAFSQGATVYIASVAKTMDGVIKAERNLQSISVRYNVPTLMANFVGQCDGEDCGGRSRVWDEKGHAVAELNDANEGVIIYDMRSKVAETISL